MTRSWFLTRCNQVWKSAGLSELTGHCFRIGGATELLLRGVPPDVIAVQGHWKSRAFLEYWSKIDLILPLFVTLSFSDTHVAMIHSSMDSFNHRYKQFYQLQVESPIFTVASLLPGELHLCTTECEHFAQTPHWLLCCMVCTVFCSLA